MLIMFLMPLTALLTTNFTHVTQFTTVKHFTGRVLTFRRDQTFAELSSCHKTVDGNYHHSEPAYPMAMKYVQFLTDSHLGFRTE